MTVDAPRLISFKPTVADASSASTAWTRDAGLSLREEIATWFHQRAAAVDEGRASAHEGLSFLAQRNLLALGVSPSLGDGGTLEQSIELIAASNEAHQHRTLLSSLKQGRIFGATGLADAVRYAAGMGRLRVEATSNGEVDGSEAPYRLGVCLRGFVPWATNLVDRRFFIAVAAARPPDDAKRRSEATGPGEPNPPCDAKRFRDPEPPYDAKKFRDPEPPYDARPPGEHGAQREEDQRARADVDDNGFFIAVVPGDAPGLRVQPAPPLLALGASASGSVQLDRVPLEQAHVLSEDGAAFLARVRPSFLLLQCGLPWGIGAAALGAVLSVPLTGDKAALASRRDELVHRFNHLMGDVRRLARTIFSGRNADRTGVDGGRPLIHAIMRTRKQLSEVAMHAVQLELEAQGGAGYAAGSPTARRWREAAFLPLQTPTLAQLQHQLDPLGDRNL